MRDRKKHGTKPKTQVQWDGHDPGQPHETHKARATGQSE